MFSTSLKIHTQQRICKEAERTAFEIGRAIKYTPLSLKIRCTFGRYFQGGIFVLGTPLAYGKSSNG
jgi:hypothetical protein